VTAGDATPTELVATTIRSPAAMPVPAGIVMTAGEPVLFPVTDAVLTRAIPAGAAGGPDGGAGSAWRPRRRRAAARSRVRCGVQAGGPAAGAPASWISMPRMVQVCPAGAVSPRVCDPAAAAGWYANSTVSWLVRK